MKTIILLTLSLMFVGCASAPKASEIVFEPMLPMEDLNINITRDPSEKVSRAPASIVSNVKDFMMSEAIDGGLVIKCFVQMQDEEAVNPCGLTDVEVREMTTGKIQKLHGQGDSFIIPNIEGENEVKVTMKNCDLPQTATGLKAGDVFEVQFPPLCGK